MRLLGDWNIADFRFGFTEDRAMEILQVQSFHRDRRVETAWSLHVTMLDVLLSI